LRFTAADVGLQEAFRRFDQIVQRPFCVGVALQKPPGQEARSGTHFQSPGDFSGDMRPDQFREFFANTLLHDGQ
jgi:hypothetical protein